MLRTFVALMFIALIVGSALVFRTIDASSHSVSDTIRPVVITLGPLWVVAVLAARIVLRGGRA